MCNKADALKLLVDNRTIVASSLAKLLLEVWAEQ